MDAREKSIAAQGLLITGACPFISVARVDCRKVSNSFFFSLRPTSATALQNGCT